MDSEIFTPALTDFRTICLSVSSSVSSFSRFRKEASYNHIKAERLTTEQVEKVEEWCASFKKKVYPLAIQLNLSSTEH